MNFILTKKVLIITLIVLIFLIIFKKFKISQMLMTFSALFLTPFLLYTYPSLLLDILLCAIGPIEKEEVFRILPNLMIIGSLTVIIAGILIKINVKPFSKNSAEATGKKEYISLERGQRILKYSIWYTLYITITHLPFCILITIVSSFSPMVIFYGPSYIFVVIMMYGLTMLMSINGVFRVRGKSAFKILILMFIPVVNFIMMIKLSFEAKKRLKEVLI